MIDTADWVFDYNLSNKIEYLGKFTNTPAFEIKSSDNYITGFRITIRQSSLEDAEIKSNNKANNLKNYLIVESGMPTDINLIGYEQIKHDGLRRVSGSLRLLSSIKGAINDLNMNDENIFSIINQDGIKKLELDYFSKAIFHRYNNNLVDEDCRHNTLLYEPAKEGACFCGCH